MALLVIAAALRLPGIWQFELWQDEIYSVYEARELFWSTIGPGGMELRPLYFLLLHPLAEAFPRSAAVLRFPAFIFGLLGIVAVWQLTNRLFGRWAALLAASLTVILPLHITESQSIRYWSLIFLLGTLLCGSLLRALETDRPRDYLVTLVWLVIAAFTHPTFLISASGLVLGAHLVRTDGTFGFQWPTRTGWMRLWLPFLGILALFYASLALFFPVKRMVGESVGSVARLFPAVAVALTTAVAAAAIVAVALLLRSTNATHRRLALMVITGLTVPAAVLSIGRSMNFLPVSILYLFATFPVVLAAIGSLVPSLAADAAGHPRVAVLLLILLGAALGPSTISHLRDGTRFDYRPALQRIKADDPRGTVVIWPKIEATWHAPDLTAIEFQRRMQVTALDSLATVGRFWVVTSLRRYGTINDPDDSKVAWLDHHCTRVHREEKLRFDWEVYAVTLYRCGEAGAGP